MYKFTDTTIQECRYNQDLPISAMNYNGVYLEELIDGYQTLSVDGREMINVEISADNLNVGSSIYYHRLPPRIITVNYALVNDNPYQLMIEYRKLMNYLYQKEQVEIYFNDELDVFYKGIYQSSSEVPGNTTRIVSSFQIYCESPLKHTVKTFVSDGYIGAETPLDTYPLKITCKTTSNQQLKINNKKETMMLRSGTIKAGDVIVFDFVKKRILVNGTDKTNYIELSSPFEYFKLFQGDTIKSNNGSIEIEYKGVTL